MSSALQYLVILVALLGFWAIVVRPTRKRQREAEQMQSALVVGDRVLMSAGVFGTLKEINDDRVKIEIAPGTVIEAMRQVVIEKQDDVGRAEHPLANGGDATEDD